MLRRTYLDDESRVGVGAPLLPPTCVGLQVGGDVLQREAAHARGQPSRVRHHGTRPAHVRNREALQSKHAAAFRMTKAGNHPTAAGHLASSGLPVICGGALTSLTVPHCPALRKGIPANATRSLTWLARYIICRSPHRAPALDQADEVHCLRGGHHIHQDGLQATSAEHWVISRRPASSPFPPPHQALTEAQRAGNGPLLLALLGSCLPMPP